MVLNPSENGQQALDDVNVVVRVFTDKKGFGNNNGHQALDDESKNGYRALHDASKMVIEPSQKKKSLITNHKVVTMPSMTNREMLIQALDDASKIVNKPSQTYCQALDDESENGYQVFATSNPLSLLTTREV